MEIGGNETDLVDSELDSRNSSVTFKSKDNTSEQSSKIHEAIPVINKSSDSPKLKPRSKRSKGTLEIQGKHISPAKADDDEPISTESEPVLIEKDLIGKKESPIKGKETKIEKSREPKIIEGKSSPQAERIEIGNNKKPKTTPDKKTQTSTRATKVSNDKKSVEIAATSQKKICSKNKEPPMEKTKIEDDENAADVSVVIKSSSDSESLTSSNDESKYFAEESTPRINSTPKIARDEARSSKKNLTPKQVQLMEQRRKAREEKERRLQEEKLQKQREKEAKELSKKLEREEREEQRRKEREERDEQKRKGREERDEQKRKEREEKERKRVAEQEVKNEEKRKRNEAKEEEFRKKEEERKRKEGACLKARKEAEAFQKFFKSKRAANADGEAVHEQTPQNDGNDSEMLAFRPFEVKGDMKLAPIHRRQLNPTSREQLDTFLGTCTDVQSESNILYLDELNSGKIVPGIWRRISVDTKISEDDVQIIGSNFLYTYLSQLLTY